MRVLFATDFSRPADQAATLVSRLPWPVGTAIRIATVIEPATAAVTFVPDGVAVSDESAESEFAEAVERVARDIRATGITVDTTVTFGRPADGIVTEAERFEADLVVVGSRGRGSVRSALLGSVSAEIVDRAPCPVLVARGERIRQILFAEDGTPRTSEAAGVLRWKVFANMPVQVVSVAETPLPFELNDETRAAIQAADRYLDSVRRARERHESIARQSAERLHADGLSASGEILEGNAASAIVAAATTSRADLIVLGSRGDRGLTRLLVGSVARDVLYSAPCSVLIARHRPTISKEGRAPVAAAPGQVSVGEDEEVVSTEIRDARKA